MWLIYALLLATISIVIATTIEPPPQPDRTTSPPPSLSYSKLVEYQIDGIKDIVSAEAIKTHHQYPVVTRKDQDEQSELETLRKKCAQFLKRLNTDETNELPQTTTPTETPTPTNAYEAKSASDIPEPKSYISLRPLTLQKTVINGMTYYYLYNRQIRPADYGLQQQQNYQTTTELMPQYEIEYGKDPPSSSGAAAVSVKVEPLYRQQFKFIVPHRVQGAIKDATLGQKLINPFEFDEFAYYPKHMQPEWMSIPVPYRPTWHMIRRLTVPNNSPWNSDVNTEQGPVGDDGETSEMPKYY